MKLILWNINSRTKKISESAIKLIMYSLRSCNPDFVVLTEFVHTAKMLSELGKIGYKTYESRGSEGKGKNGVLIAVKNKFIIKSVLELPVGEIAPNFLCLSLIANGGKVLNVVGTRIEIGGRNKDADFRDRKRQLLVLLKQLREIKGPIALVGDFNNGWYRGNDTLTSYLEKPRRYYNYPLLKAFMELQGFEANTPDGNSWGEGYKLDHMFTSATFVTELEYSWYFQNAPEYQNKVGFPDHAQLIAEFELS